MVRWLRGHRPGWAHVHTGTGYPYYLGMEISGSFVEFMTRAATVVGSVATLLGVMRSMGKKSERDRLQQDIAMISQLPPDDPRTQRALDEVYAKLERLQNEDYAMSRDALGMFLGAVIALAFGALSGVFAAWGGYWWIGFAVTTLVTIFGAAGFFMSFQLKVRDDNGNVVKSPKESDTEQQKPSTQGG